MQRIDPQFSTPRTNLGVHPDGGVAGTEGCIGLLDADSTPWYNAFYAVARTSSVEVVEGRDSLTDTEEGGTSLTAHDIRGMSELLSTTVKTLNDANADGQRLFFPRGIELIQLIVAVKEGRIEVKLAGPQHVSEGIFGSAPGEGQFLAFGSDDLTQGQAVPPMKERDAVGAPTSRIERDTPAFRALVKNMNPDIVFKESDDRHPDSDHMMTPTLRSKVDSLAALVKREWPGTKLRVTEAWDEELEHGTPFSTHYEARAVDITTFPIDKNKLGRLGRLAVNAGFGWVFFEDANHIHGSVAK